MGEYFSINPIHNYMLQKLIKYVINKFIKEAEVGWETLNEILNNTIEST